jgi:hypothetical protein
MQGAGIKIVQERSALEAMVHKFDEDEERAGAERTKVRTRFLGDAFAMTCSLTRAAQKQ